MNTMKQFLKSDLATGTLLIIATILALFLANSPLEHVYHYLISDVYILGEFNIHMIINDFLMAILWYLKGRDNKLEQNEARKYLRELMNKVRSKFDSEICSVLKRNKVGCDEIIDFSYDALNEILGQ